MDTCFENLFSILTAKSKTKQICTQFHKIRLNIPQNEPQNTSKWVPAEYMP